MLNLEGYGTLRFLETPGSNKHDVFELSLDISAIPVLVRVPALIAAVFGISAENKQTKFERSPYTDRLPLVFEVCVEVDSEIPAYERLNKWADAIIEFLDHKYQEWENLVYAAQE